MNRFLVSFVAILAVCVSVCGWTRSFGPANTRPAHPSIIPCTSVRPTHFSGKLGRDIVRYSHGSDGQKATHDHDHQDHHDHVHEHDDECCGDPDHNHDDFTHGSDGQQAIHDHDHQDHHDHVHEHDDECCDDPDHNHDEIETTEEIQRYIYGPPENLSSTIGDREHLYHVLRNISTSEQAAAMSLAMHNLGFFLSRNITLLYASLLSEATETQALGSVDFSETALQELEAGYEFTMNFIDVFSEQTSKLFGKYRSALKAIFEAVGTPSQISDAAVEKAILDHRDVLVSQGFLAYLDAEIDDQERGSEMHRFLRSVKLRILSEVETDARISEELKVIPRLAAMDDKVSRKMELEMFLYSQGPNLVSDRSKALTDALDEAIGSIKQRENVADVRYVELLQTLEEIRTDIQTLVEPHTV